MSDVTVQQMTCTHLPTDTGVFRLCLYHNSRDEKEHLALVMGDVSGQRDVLVRVHSECLTGDLLGSRRCDCGPQLAAAMAAIAAEQRGVLLYMRQEGRGIGLLDKLRAYNLQDAGYDTVDANLMLGHQADARDYTLAALMLQDLDVASIRLLTNNPDKIEGLQALGIGVASRVPLPSRVTPENANYLATKVTRMRHLMQVGAPATANGQAVLAPEAPPVPAATVARLAPDGDGTPARQPAAPAGRPCRPRVTLSYAQSLDGSITHRRGQPLALSGPESLALTHRLRAGHDGILIGVGTALADDPRLSVRLADGLDPQPIIVDSRLRLPTTGRLWQHPTRSPWIATTTAADPRRQQALEAAGARVLRLPPDRRQQVDLPALLRRLGQLGIQRLMVEGGAGMITSFLAGQLADRVVVTIAPRFVGGLKAVNGSASPGTVQLPRLQRVRYQQLGEDMVIFGDVAAADGA